MTDGGTTRERHVGPASYLAECLGCAWASDARNAMGNAARHHDATGHPVRVDTRRVVTYGNPAAPMDGQVELELDATA